MVNRPKQLPRLDVSSGYSVQTRKKMQTMWAAVIASIGIDLSGFLRHLSTGRGVGGVHIFGAAQDNYHITPEQAAKQVREVECVQPRPWRSWQHYWRRASSVNHSSRRQLRRKYEAAIQRANAST